MKEVNHKIVLHAADLVKKGYAQWKPEMDEVKVEEIFREWKTEKMVGTMFGNKPR